MTNLRDRATWTRREAALGTRWRRTALGVWAGATLIVVIAVLPGRVDAQELFYQAYENGLKAFNAGNLDEAQRRFLRALELDSKQSREKRFYGMTFRSYVPEYYLGLIAMQQKQYQRALYYFARVEQAGLVKRGDKDYERLSSETTAARAALTTPAVVAGSRGEPPPPTSRPAANPTGSPTTAAEARRGGPPAAAPVVAPATTPPAASPPASTSPPAATTNPAPDLQAQIDGLLQRRNYEEAWSTTDRLAGPANAPARQAAKDRVRSAINRDVRDQLRRDNLREADRLLAIDSTWAPADSSIAALKQSVANRRVMLTLEREAFTLLLQGEYRRAVEVASARVGAPDASTRLLFYAACSTAGLALLTAENREAQLRAARDLFSRAAPGNAQFVKEERYISPQILEVLRNPNATSSKR